MLHELSRLLPAPFRAPLRRLYHSCKDGINVQIGRRDPLIPPDSLHKVGGSPYEETGEEFFRYFLDLCGLKPDARILDIGSGTGRMARPLTRYLENGSYDGIDIVSESIKWCNKTYTPRYRNFRFHSADIYNKVYNPNGRYRAREFRLPFENTTFDFIFLTSVFTHMMPADVEHYLSEISRVLREGGKCLITFFLLNDQSWQQIRKGLGSFTFQHKLQGCWVEHEDTPEGVVGYDEGAIRTLYSQYGLRICGPIHYGKWCQREGGLSLQDIIIADRHR